MDEHELRKRFGRLVTANRRRRGLTQQQLSAATGISVEMINRVERGVTGARFPNIAKIADALGIDPAELFTSEIPSGSIQRPARAALSARLDGLTDRDLHWVEGLLDAALKPRR